MSIATIDLVSGASITLICTLQAVATLCLLRLLKLDTARLKYNVLSLCVAAMLLTPIAMKPFELELPIQRPQDMTLNVNSFGDHAPNFTLSSHTSQWFAAIEIAIAGIWVTGAAITFIAFAWQMRRYTWLPACPAYKQTAAIQQRLAASKNPHISNCMGKVSVSRSITSPCIVGVIRSRIVLPIQAPTWKQQTLETVVLHELQHIRSGDLLRSVVASSLVIGFWFHPLIWKLLSHLFEERERACDEKVIQYYAIDTLTYFEQILAVAKSIRQPAAVPAIGTKERLLSRIDWMTGQHKSSSISTRILALGGFAALFVLLSCCNLKLAQLNLRMTAQADPTSGSVKLEQSSSSWSQQNFRLER